MLCPRCGMENPESAGRCSQCGYTFSFGSGYNDPRTMRFLSADSAGKSRIKRIVLVCIAIAGLAAVLIMWLRSINL